MNWVTEQKAELQKAEQAAKQQAGNSGCYVGVVSRWSGPLGVGYIECKESSSKFGGDIQILRDQFGDLEICDTVLFQVAPDDGQGGPRKAAFARQITQLTLQRRRILKVEVPCPERGVSETPQEFLGFISSFGASAGFGFISCAQTRQTYGAEVYIHRDQYLDTAIGDAVHFRVAMNSKGVPVARGVRKALAAAPAPTAPAPAPVRASLPAAAKQRSCSRSASMSMSISAERKEGKSSAPAPPASQTAPAPAPADSGSSRRAGSRERAPRQRRAEKSRSRSRRRRRRSRS